MKSLHYHKPNRLDKLHDELLSAIPELRPVPRPGAPGEQLPVMMVEGLEDDIWLTVADDADEARIAAVVEAHAPTTWRPPFPTSTHWARVEAMNPGAVKPLTVRRTYSGYDYTFDCYVSEELVQMYQEGKLAVGDFVLVDFVEEDPDLPLAVTKVRRTW